MTLRFGFVKRHQFMPDMVMHACHAEIGAGVPCTNLAQPNREVCTFHAGLLGPWSKASSHHRFF